MKRIFFLLLISALFLNFTACFDDDSKPPAGGGDDTTNPLEGYTSTDITYEDGSTIKGYALDQFVPITNVNTEIGFEDDDETRGLFLYRVIGADGWNPFDDKGKIDLTWAEFNSGYLLEKAYDAKVYFPSEDIAKTYDVKNAQDINLYRKIDIIKNASGTPVIIPFEINTLTSVDLTYWNFKKKVVKNGKGLSITSILSDYIIDESVDKAGYFYKFNLVDGFIGDGTTGPLNNIITFSDFQAAYFIYEEDGEPADKIIALGTDYTGSNNGGAEATAPTQLFNGMKYPVSIEFVDNTAGNDNPIGDDDGTATAPAQTATSAPDIQFTFPAQ